MIYISQTIITTLSDSEELASQLVQDELQSIKTMY